MRGETSDVCNESSFHSKILHGTRQNICSYILKEREQHLNETNLSSVH